MTTEERIERCKRNNRRLLTGLVAVILLGIGVAATPKHGGDVVDEPWPKWKMSFYGSGWQVRDATGYELIKTAENQKHDVGIFVSGKRFQGSIEDLFATLKSIPGVPDRDKYTLTKINGNKAIQLFSSMSQGGEQVKVWGLMFLRSNSIIALQGLYKDDKGKKFLQRTMTSFKFVASGSEGLSAE